MHNVRRGANVTHETCYVDDAPGVPANVIERDLEPSVVCNVKQHVKSGHEIEPTSKVKANAHVLRPVLGHHWLEDRSRRRCEVQADVRRESYVTANTRVMTKAIAQLKNTTTVHFA